MPRRRGYSVWSAVTCRIPQVNDLVSGNWDTKYNVILNQVYLFELFDESQKTGPSGMEPHWGLLNEDTSPKGPTGGGFTILN